MDTLNSLDAIIGEIMDLQHAALLLEWDEMVYRPPCGATPHGHSVATIRKLAHERLISDQVGELLTRLRSEAAGLEPTSDAARNIAMTARDYDKARRVPPEFVAEQARAVSAAQHAWVEAR